MRKSRGLVYVFTGEGKGKTSAALGVTLRALLREWKVVWMSFIKEEGWDVAEKKLGEWFSRLEMYFGGKGFYLRNSKLKMQNAKLQLKTQKLKTGEVVVDKVGEDEHKRAAKESLALVREKLMSGRYQLVVMDEVLNAVSEGLLSEEEVREVVELREESHVVLTGRGGGKWLREVADLITQCEKMKHPYDEGISAIKGLDY